MSWSLHGKDSHSDKFLPTSLFSQPAHIANVGNRFERLLLDIYTWYSGINETLVKEHFAQFDETDEIIQALNMKEEKNSSQQEDEEDLEEEEQVLTQLTEEILNLGSEARLIEVQSLMDRSVAWYNKYVKWSLTFSVNFSYVTDKLWQ